MWTWALLRIAVVNTWSVRMSAKCTLQQAVQGGAAVSHGVDLEESGFGVGPPGRRYRAQILGVSGRCHRVVATVLVGEGVVGAAYVDGTGPGGYR